MHISIHECFFVFLVACHGVLVLVMVGILRSACFLRSFEGLNSHCSGIAFAGQSLFSGSGTYGRVRIAT